MRPGGDWRRGVAASRNGPDEVGTKDNRRRRHGGRLTSRGAAVEEDAADDGIVAADPGHAYADAAGDRPGDVGAAVVITDGPRVEQRVGRRIEHIHALTATGAF